MTTISPSIVLIFLFIYCTCAHAGNDQNSSNQIPEPPVYWQNDSRHIPDPPVYWQNDTSQGSPNTVEQHTFRHTSDLGLVEWNSLTEPGLHFHIRICGNICNHTQFLKVFPEDGLFCPFSCFPCSCSPTCYLEGRCCPHFDPQTPPKESDVNVTEPDGAGLFVGDLSEYRFIDFNYRFRHSTVDPGHRRILTLNTRFQCSHVKWPRHLISSVYMVATCPASETNQTLRYLCEAEDDMETISSLFLTPLSDSRNNVTFKNVYCAECNYSPAYDNDDDINYSATNNNNNNNTFLPYQILYVYNQDRLDHRWLKFRQKYLRPWKIHIFCDSFQNYHHLNSEDEFLKTLFRVVNGANPSLCSISLRVPHGIPRPAWCVARRPKKEHAVCPNSGSPLAHTLYDLCHKLTSIAYRYGARNNVFCYLCDNNFPPCRNVLMTPPPGIRSQEVFFPFDFLLGAESGVRRTKGFLSPEHKSKLESRFLCDQTLDWMDDKGKCQLAECAAGKVLNQLTDTCDAAVKQINSLKYKIFMLVKPKFLTHVSFLDTVHMWLFNFFYSHVEGIGVKVEYFIDRINSLRDQEYIKYLKIEGSAQSKKIKRQEFENFMLFGKEHALFSENSWFSLFNGSRILWGEETLGTLLKSRFKRSSDVFPRNSSQEHGYTKIIEREVTLDTKYTAKFGFVSGIRDNFVDLNPTLICPFVKLNISNIYDDGDNDNDVTIGFLYREREQKLNVSQYADRLDIVDGELRICIDTFRQVFQRVTTAKNTTTTMSMESKVMKYLTLVCLGISVCCLILSCVTYILFPVLRNLPGLNTLALCVCLAFAQMSLIAVTLLVGHIEGWLCQLLGIVLHYGWLLAFHWMNACCIHMFIVFNKTQARADVPNIWKPFLRYSAFAFGLSAFYTGLNITLYDQMSDGASFGYSPHRCLFDTPTSPLPPIFAFVLPLGIVVISNGALFCLTVRKIMAVTRLQQVLNASRKASRDQVATYVKLSTLTGLFWLLTILAVHLDNDILRFISIPLVGLQGLFIFFSFTFNSRVKALYKALLGSSAESTIPHTSSSPTTPTTRSTDVEKESRRTNVI